MLNELPIEILERVGSFLTHKDRVSLTYVDTGLWNKISPALYRRLYLNGQKVVPSDADPLLGNNWSVLGGSGSHFDYADGKLRALVRTLEESSVLSSHVEIVHCTWHLDVDILKSLVSVLVRKPSKLREFRNFLSVDLLPYLDPIRGRLRSLDLPPPATLPLKEVSKVYLPRLSNHLRHHRWENITSVRLYLDPGLFFANYSPFDRKLRVRELNLSLRGDEYDPSSLKTPRISYSEVFDVEFLEKLTILSWHEKQDIDIYEHYHLFELLAFKNLKELTLMSFFPNDTFLRECVRSFGQLRRLKLDYMFGHAVSSNIINLMAMSPCHNTLQYLDLKFWQLDPYLVTMEQGPLPHFVLNETCKCDLCADVFKSILLKKVFPHKSALKISGIEDATKRDIITKLISIDPIVPYTQFVDTRPAMSVVENPVQSNAASINEALGISEASELALNAEDIIQIYHAHLHSLKRTFDFFLQKFPHLRFLNMNDVPTIICEGPGGQRYNIPAFNSSGYLSNQVYEVVDENSLFD